MTTSHDCVPEDLVMVINHLSSTSTSAAHIKDWTAKDPCILRFLNTDWSSQKLDKSYQPYTSRKNELSVLDLPSWRYRLCERFLLSSTYLDSRQIQDLSCAMLNSSLDGGLQTRGCRLCPLHSSPGATYPYLHLLQQYRV